jgi:peptidoglycan/LPS O-acetylase OafA/YrhL
MNTTDEQRPYLPGLDGLRFLGALAVVIHHIEQWKSLARIPSKWLHPVVQSLGPQGVNLFFTLSGFLITYLLVTERQRTGGISISQFMIRRALRILPLYYLVVLLAFFVLPWVVGGTSRIDRAVLAGHEALAVCQTPVLLLFLLVLPNVAHLNYPPVPFAAQGWSIGVEEQFYLVWPWVLLVAGRRLAWVAGAGFAAYTALRFLPSATIEETLALSAPWGFLARYFLSLPIEYLSAGALAAAIFHGAIAGNERTRAHRLIVNRFAGAAALPLVLALLCGALPAGPWNGPAYAIVILNFVSCRQRWLNLELPVFRYLGQISYGIYMFHSLAIYAAVKLVDSVLTRSEHRGLYGASLYGGSLLLTVALAALSHRYYERWFRELRGSRPSRWGLGTAEPACHGADSSRSTIRRAA